MSRNVSVAPLVVQGLVVVLLVTALAFASISYVQSGARHEDWTHTCNDVVANGVTMLRTWLVLAIAGICIGIVRWAVIGMIPVVFGVCNHGAASSMEQTLDSLAALPTKHSAGSLAPIMSMLYIAIAAGASAFLWLVSGAFYTLSIVGLTGPPPVECSGATERSFTEHWQGPNRSALVAALCHLSTILIIHLAATLTRSTPPTESQNVAYAIARDGSTSPKTTNRSGGNNSVPFLPVSFRVS